MMSKVIALEAAVISCLTYVSLLLLEWLRPGFVSTVIDLNLVLLLVILLMIWSLLQQPKQVVWSWWQRWYYGLWLLLNLAGLFVLFWRQTRAGFTVNMFILACLLAAVSTLYCKRMIKSKE